MARKREESRAIGPDWFLKEWMEVTGVKQADMIRAFDWGKATASDIVNGKTGYYRQIVNQLASLMQIQPWELLMHPDEAAQIRRLRHTMEEEHRLRLVADAKVPFTPAPGETAPLNPKRRAN